MVNLYIIANGSNDLYYAVGNSLHQIKRELLKDKDINLYVLFKLKKCGHMDLWTKNSSMMNLESSDVIGFVSKNGEVENIDVSPFFREVDNSGSCQFMMAPELFLEKYLNNNSKNPNIVILSGHGGPFQSFLDMSLSPSASINTVSLCKKLKRFKIDLLFMDMCAMNYIELIYELLHGGVIKNIITYKNLAPFDGINYRDFLEGVLDQHLMKLNFHGFKEIEGAPLIRISKDKIRYLEAIRRVQCKIIKDMVGKENPDFDTELKSILKNINLAAEQNRESQLINSSPMNYIKYRLTDKNEQKLYSQYSYSKDNLWQMIVRGRMGADYSYDPLFINLDKESLENIVYLHNSNLSQREVKKKVEQIIVDRGEASFYLDDR